MLSSSLLVGLRGFRAGVVSSRNIGVTAPALAAATDPIQKLFVDKIKEYSQKSSGGKLVDPTPEIERELKQEMEKLEKQFGGGKGVDMTKFPDFKFDEPKLDPINMEKPAEK